MFPGAPHDFPSTRLPGDDARQTAVHPEDGQVPHTQLSEHLIANIDRCVPQSLHDLDWFKGKPTGNQWFVPYLPSQKRGVEMKPPNNITGFG